MAGFGDNLRVLEWMIKRVKGEVGAIDTPIGALPQAGHVNLDDVELSDEARAKLFGFDRDGWREEFASLEGFLDEFGERTPLTLKAEQRRIADELK